MIEIIFHLICKKILCLPVTEHEIRKIPLKPFTDRRLAEMSERRVADVMDQPCALQNMGDILLHLRRKPGIFPVLQNILAHVLPQRLSQRRDLKRMCQPGSDKIALVKRKDLSLVLKPAEGSAADNPVVILLKFASQVC